VLIHVDSHEQGQGISFDIRCHAEGYPKPTITWMFEDQPVKQGAKYHIQMCKYIFSHIRYCSL
jgi:hypothetical protein